MPDASAFTKIKTKSQLHSPAKAMKRIFAQSEHIKLVWGGARHIFLKLLITDGMNISFFCVSAAFFLRPEPLIFPNPDVNYGLKYFKLQSHLLDNLIGVSVSGPCRRKQNRAQRRYCIFSD